MKRSLLAIVFFIILLVPLNLWAEDLFVRDDSGEYGVEDGLSYDTAFDGFADIVWGEGAGKVGPGDTLYVCDTIAGEQLTVGDDGESGSVITIRGDLASHAGTINANSVVARCINVGSYDYITILNITIMGTDAADGGAYNISSDTGSTNLTIDTVESKDGSWGGGLKGSNIIVKDSTFHDNVRDGLVVSQATSPQVLRCKFYNNATLASSNNEGLFIGNGCTNFLVEECHSYSNNSGRTNNDGAGFDSSASPTLGDVSGVYRRCKSNDNGGPGFKCSGEDKGDDNIVYDHCISYDNTFNYYAYENITVAYYNCNSGRANVGNYPVGIMAWNANSDVVMTVQNCIFSGAQDYYYWIDRRYVTLVSSYNTYNGATVKFAKNQDGGLTYTFAEWKALNANYDSAGSDEEDPLFVSTVDGSENFELQPNSPCIDDGTNAPGESHDGGILPGSSWTAAVSEDDQDNYGAAREKGAYIYSPHIYNAVPPDDATGVTITPIVSWSLPVGEITNDGYFKVGPCPCEVGDLVWSNQAHKTSYDPGTLGYNTTHCWRVDIDHAGGTEEGQDYEFTTTTQQNPPSPKGAVFSFEKGGRRMTYEKGGMKIE